ncbi:MAG: hypothetical protein RLP44_12030 [Aggregatilineales bacterium]
MQSWFGKLFFLGIILSVGMTQAQGNTCSELVEQALARVGNICDGLQRNQACYGHNSLEAELISDATFDTEGDIALLQDIQRLTLRGMDVEDALWGISMLSMQANLPDTLPGQNITFVLFGDVTLENATVDSTLEDDTDTANEAEENEFSAPMQAFYFTSGIGQPDCVEAPQNGLMIQTPEGSGEVTFQANGVQVELGSTAFLQAEAGGEMIVSVIEGQATLTAFDVTVTAPAGSQVRIQLDDDGIVADAPGQPQAYDLDDLIGLPLILLEREIEIALPLQIIETIVDDDADGTTATPSASSGNLQASADGGSELACSVDGSELYTFTVDNRSDRTVLLYWIDYNCNRVLYRTILPGTTIPKETFATHPWILTDAETDETFWGPWGSNTATPFTITVTNEGQ